MKIFAVLLSTPSGGNYINIEPNGGYIHCPPAILYLPEDEHVIYVKTTTATAFDRDKFPWVTF